MSRAIKIIFFTINAGYSLNANQFASKNKYFQHLFYVFLCFFRFIKDFWIIIRVNLKMAKSKFSKLNFNINDHSRLVTGFEFLGATIFKMKIDRPVI